MIEINLLVFTFLGILLQNSGVDDVKLFLFVACWFDAF